MHGWRSASSSSVQRASQGAAGRQPACVGRHASPEAIRFVAHPGTGQVRCSGAAAPEACSWQRARQGAPGHRAARSALEHGQDAHESAARRSRLICAEHGAGLEDGHFSEARRARVGCSLHAVVTAGDAAVAGCEDEGVVCANVLLSGELAERAAGPARACEAAASCAPLRLEAPRTAGRCRLLPLAERNGGREAALGVVCTLEVSHERSGGGPRAIMTLGVRTRWLM